MLCRINVRKLMTLGGCLILLTAGSQPARRIASSPTKQKEAGEQVKGSQVRESPFACNVKALDRAQRQRWMELIQKLGAARQEVRELPDGYAFRFPADTTTVMEVAEFIGYERLCCPFFDFELAVEREGGPLWLRLRGREGVRDFIRSEFGIQQK
jgi:hypothetical protein